MALLLAVAPAAGLPYMVNEIPHGDVVGCAVCHEGGAVDTLTTFGLEVRAYFLRMEGTEPHVVWSPLLANYDSDLDKVTNGKELMDPYGVWMTGQPAPGDSARVTDPGDMEDYILRDLTVSFSDMGQYMGQRLNMRVVDAATTMEMGRTTDEDITGAQFDLSLQEVLTDTGVFFVDIFIDSAGNGQYTPPPAGDAWRIMLDHPGQNATVQFDRTDQMTDIRWVYLANLNLTNFTPHLGQTIIARIVQADSLTPIGDMQVTGYKRWNIVTQPDFTIMIPGIVPGRTNYLEFFADFNENNLYDPPPTDHVWRLEMTNPTGDTTITFEHNTNFTDVDFTRLFVQHYHDMTPHLGDYFALRVVNAQDQEVGRIEVDSLTTSEFSLPIIGIRPDLSGDTTAYRADFWADFNNNGMYDPPPTDHAWRVFFADTTGDVVLNFFHNTNFTDIDWPTVSVLPWDPSNPVTHLLARAWPNPFNPAARIAFDLPIPAFVTLKVYNLRGEAVATLFEGQQVPGRYEAVWQPGDLASGIYLYRLTAGANTLSGKLVLLK
ncbi:MAG: T9SS C-terminal target domain-containing protein [Candidatus Zixiibacteriota bacterium]|nr:MAG: T9SS C-terminal target domain-containing protein [candidate division Zixibacteria bacterium]